MPSPEMDRRAVDLGRLATPAGGFAMLAIDQRVSLETMFEEAGRVPEQGSMDDFRVQVLEVLGPHASAVLVERGLVERGRMPALGGPPPGRILAGERLEQVRGHGATGSSIDPECPAIAAAWGASALKLMAVWRIDTPPEPVVDLVDTFVARAHAAGLLAVVEGIVRGPAGVTPDAFLAATAAMGRSADLYKAQPPVAGGIDDRSVTALAREVSAVLDRPWVVLSTGVPEDRFPAVLAAACRGGASGFLAGRAIWGHAVGATDVRATLGGPARERMRELKEIVAADARPWQEVAPARGDTRRA